MIDNAFQLIRTRSWGSYLARSGQVVISRTSLLIVTPVILTLIMLWPLPLHAGSAVQDLGDPLYEIWTMRWVQHQLLHDPAHLWNGNTGYPFPDSLLFSEPRISTSVIAWPVQLLSGNNVLAYNVMLMGSYVVVGLGMSLLIWELTGELGAALLAGVVSAFAPYRYGHLSHLNLLSYGWSLLALWLLIRFARKRSLADAALSALFLTIQILASDTAGVMTGFMVVVAIGVVLWQERKRMDAKLIAGVTGILALPALVELPIALARLRVDQIYGFTRDLETVSQMSATLQSYVSVSPGNRFWDGLGILPVAYPNPLFPGLIAALAALAGIVLAGRHWPGWTIFATFIAVTGAILSLGPYTTIDGHRFHLPYYALYRFVPGFDAMRDAARFGMLALIGIEILAGLGLAAIWKMVRPKLPRQHVARIGPLVMIVVLLLAAVELKTDVGTAHVPNDQTSDAVYDWLARQPDGPVIEFPANGLWSNLGWTTREIYSSTRHWHPIVAAYTSFLPQRDIDMLIAIHGGTDTPSLVSAANVGLLQDLDIRYVVIHHWPDYDWQQALTEAERLPELTPAGDIGDASVFTLAPGNRVPVSYDVVAPFDALAGNSIVADVITRNDNPTGAISWLHPDPEATITWRSATGDFVSSARLPIHLKVTADPGLTHQPISLTAPPEPGSYQLTIDVPVLHRTAHQAVHVTAGSSSVSPSIGAPLVLRRLDVQPGPYRPGQILSVAVEWEVRRTPLIDLNATLQLINRQNKPFGQWDGLPLGPDLPTSQWAAGSIIVEPMLIRVPADATAAEFRMMVALYDESSASLQRLRVERPDGSTDLQYFSDPLEITP